MSGDRGFASAHGSAGAARRARRGRRFVALAALLAAASGAAGLRTPAEEPEWGLLSPELAAVLEAKTKGYERRALKFSCLESVRDARYEGEEANKEKVTQYEYLLVADPDAPEGYRGVRSKPGSKDGKEERVDFAFPDPYLWSQLFRPAIRSTLKFQTGIWRTTPWRLAIPIFWISAAPVSTRVRTTEWSGSVDVEYRTGNILRVVARPSLQDERLMAELSRYLQAFRFMGFSTAPPPIGQELTVDFDFEADGFTYPTRAELVTFRQTSRSQRETVSRRVVEYTNYRFFGAKVEDRIPALVWEPGPPPGSDALPLPPPRPTTPPPPLPVPKPIPSGAPAPTGR